MEIQARIPAALCAMHNFIRIHDTADDIILTDDDHDGNLFDHDHVASASAAAEIDEPSARRDRIAENMWADYLEVCREREYEGYPSDSDDSASRDSDDSALRDSDEGSEDGDA
jgi:hypothetical protein